MVLRSALIFIINIISIRTYAQVTDDSMLIQGVYRTFHYTQPAGSTKNYHPVFVLHGSGLSGKIMMKFATSLIKAADTEKVFPVFPDSYKAWNNGRRAPSAGDMKEEAFFDSMLVYFNRHFQTRKDRAFAIGISAGGVMAYKLAMTMPEKFKAISTIVANLPDTIYCEQKRKPVAVMITNGTKDRINPYEGGEMILNGKVAGYAKSTEYTFRYWAEINGYKGDPVKTELPITDSTRQRITKHSFKKKRKPEVTLLQVHDMGHDNPKAVDIFLESIAFFKRNRDW
jgi:polyhydroxybutyrate depolymerase